MGGSVTSKSTVVGAVLRGRVGFHPRVCRVCGCCGCVVVWGGGGVHGAIVV